MSYGLIKPPVGAQLNRNHPLAKGLVGCWLFNEGKGLRANDYSGNGNHGTLVNGPIWTGGQSGNSLLFDGSDDNVNLPTLFKTDQTMSGFTIIFSANCHEYATSTVRRTIIDNWKAYSTKKGFLISLGTLGVTDQMILQTFILLNDGTNNWNSFVSLGDLRNTNQVYAVVFSASSYIKYYRLGCEIAYYNVGIPSQIIFTNTTTIGYGSVNSGRFDGSISDVMIWNRALSQQEISSLYSQPYQMFEPTGIIEPKDLYKIPSKGRLPIKLF